MSAPESSLDTLKRLLTNRSSNTTLGSTRFLGIMSVFAVPVTLSNSVLVEQVRVKPDERAWRIHTSQTREVVVLDDDDSPSVPAKRPQIPTFLRKTAKKSCLESSY